MDSGLRRNDGEANRSPEVCRGWIVTPHIPKQPASGKNGAMPASISHRLFALPVIATTVAWA
jgi:hypothetical protein